MGADKATLVVGGVRLVDRVVAAVQQAGIERVVVAGPPIRDLGGGVETIADPTDEAHGPLSGIVSAWRYLSARDDLFYDPVLVVSCDLPEITSEVLATLVERSLDETHGVVAHDGSSLQPLIAAYRAVALDEMTVAFDQGGRSVRGLFSGWQLASARFDPPALADADTPRDLDQFVVRWPDEPMGRGGE